MQKATKFYRNGDIQRILEINIFSFMFSMHLELQSKTGRQPSKSSGEIYFRKFRYFFAESHIPIVHLAHHALHGFGRVLLDPKVPSKYVKWTKFETFRLKKPCWPKTFGNFFQQPILPFLATISRQPAYRYPC